jgi:hypothetical protein
MGQFTEKIKHQEKVGKIGCLSLNRLTGKKICFTESWLKGQLKSY